MTACIWHVRWLRGWNENAGVALYRANWQLQKGMRRAT